MNGEVGLTQHVREKLVGAEDIDAALEESLTTTWDAKVYSWDNSKHPFDPWILNRIRGMGYELDDLERSARGRSAQRDLQSHQAALRR